MSVKNSQKQPALEVPAAAGESKESAVARAVLRPSVNAAMTLQKIGQNRTLLDLNATVAELSAQCKLASDGDLRRGEAMLVAQAHTLDMLFNTLAVRASLNEGQYLDAADRYYKLAMRAQSQCRATIETLAMMKNPPNVAFVKQQNVGQQVQVNNGVVPGSASRTGENQNEPIKLLEPEVTHGDEWLDTRAPSTTGAADKVVETMEAIDRTEDRIR
jgi:hypothetical protein